MRTLALFVIGLTFGGGIGFVTAAGMGVTFDGHDHSNPAHHGGQDHGMDHDTPLEVGADAAPEVAIDVIADAMSGYNLHVMTQNFAFSPRNASGAHVVGEGHAHVYVNGEKQGRLYGAWAHLPSLPKGDAVVTVTLNANTHQPLSVGGTPVAASTTVKVE